MRFDFVYCSEVIEQLPDVPEAKTVSAAYTSQTCPQCGHQDRENRPKLPDSDGFILDRFSCQSCGYQADADLNAGQVIAIKRMWRESLPKSQRPKLMSELKENYSFKTYLRPNNPFPREVGQLGSPQETDPRDQEFSAKSARCSNHLEMTPFPVSNFNLLARRRGLVLFQNLDEVRRSISSRSSPIRCIISAI